MNLPLELSENLVKNNKVIFVEDNTATPGRASVLAKALGAQEQHVTFYNEFSALNDDCEEILTNNDVKEVSKLFKNTSSSNVVILNSLTPMLLENSLKHVLQFLHIVRKDEKITALIVTIHGDCHSAKVVQILMNHSDLWLKIHSLDFKRTVMLKSHPKGKVEHSLYDILIENGQLIAAKISSNPVVTLVPAIVEADKPDESVLPTSSFNLNLSEKEKEDRSKVEMPYWKKKDAKIEYTPDENDDWDDEDPDDDLDF